MNKKLFIKFFTVSLTAVFILLIITVSVLSAGDARFYYKILDNNMKSVIESDFTSASNYIMASQNEANSDTNADYEAIENILSNYKGQLSINQNRRIYLLKSDDLSIVIPTSIAGEKIEKSENIITAESGIIGNKYRLFSGVMDNAYPISFGGGSYILYVKDNMSDLRAGVFYKL